MKPFLARTATFLKNNKNTDWLFLAIGLAVFGVLSLWHISAASIWFDEAFSAYIVQFSFVDIARYTAADVHPPMYYWLLKVWELFFGTSELALRSMSTFFGGVSIIFGFLLVRRLFGRKAALYSLLFLIVSPMLIRYSQEARMYTLAAAVVMAASLVLTYAVEAKKKALWVLYGVLIALGMWIHYFTALAWLAHWVWRGLVIFKKRMKFSEFRRKFFTTNWLLAHIIAVSLFLPWLPFMAIQLGGIQGTGFWIGAIGIYTPANYLTNFFYYLEQSRTLGWAAFALIVAVVTMTVLTVRVFKKLSKQQRLNYLFIIALAIVPVVLLFLVSLPPLKSSFVERYLIPAVVGLSLYIGVTIAYASKWTHTFVIAGVTVLMVGMMLFGITNVYKYGNFNKNSETHILTKQLIQEITEKAEPGQPIVSNSPWVFYEAVFYSTDEHPVYFIDENTSYEFGSLDMLKYEPRNKITDLAAFEEDNPVIWYIGTTSDDDVAPYNPSWQKLQTAAPYDSLTGKTIYRGTQYNVSSSAE